MRISTGYEFFDKFLGGGFERRMITAFRGHFRFMSLTILNIATTMCKQGRTVVVVDPTVTITEEFLKTWKYGVLRKEYGKRFLVLHPVGHLEFLTTVRQLGEFNTGVDLIVCPSPSLSLQFLDSVSPHHELRHSVHAMFRNIVKASACAWVCLQPVVGAGDKDVPPAANAVEQSLKPDYTIRLLKRHRHTAKARRIGRKAEIEASWIRSSPEMGMPHHGVFFGRLR